MAKRNQDYIFIIIGIFSVVLLFSTIELVMKKPHPPGEQHSIIQMQSGNNTHISLDQNIQLDFPAGTTSDDVITSFKEKGFNVTSNVLKTKHTATLDQTNGNCETHYKITWTTAKDGSVQNLQTHTMNTCP